MQSLATATPGLGCSSASFSLGLRAAPCGAAPGVGETSPPPSRDKAPGRGCAHPPPSARLLDSLGNGSKDAPRRRGYLRCPHCECQASSVIDPARAKPWAGAGVTGCRLLASVGIGRAPLILRILQILTCSQFSQNSPGNPDGCGGEGQWWWSGFLPRGVACSQSGAPRQACELPSRLRLDRAGRRGPPESAASSPWGSALTPYCFAAGV